MKSKNKIICTLLGGLVLVAVGCNDKLVEHPYTVFTTAYLQTPSGIQNAVNAIYSNMRYDFGPEGANGVGVSGTDEWTQADQSRLSAAGGDLISLSTYTMTAPNTVLLTPWNRNFSSINLANGVLEWAPGITFSTTPATDTTMRNTIMAEAHFLRGLCYMLLVQQFGAIPTDLGSGDLQFNTNPFLGFNRLPIADVLKKDYDAMISDFAYAATHLPIVRPTGAFKLSKAAAFHMLAKTYLYRAYSTATPNSAADFQSALATAQLLINNKGTYGTDLQPAYASVHAIGNDYNSEILYSCERVIGNQAADENNNPSGIGGTKGVDANNDFNCNYTAITAPTSISAGTPCGTRTTLYGRPIRRFCPTEWTYDSAFMDKVHDSRYDGTFRTVWLCTVATTTTTNKAGYPASTAYAVGDTAAIIAYTNQIADSINSLPVKKKYRVIAPRELYVIGGLTATQTAQNIYPSLSKYSDPNSGAANNEGTRPFPVAKLSETYLIAAEAAMQTGDKNTAMTYINVLKLRAANRAGLSASQVTNNYNYIKLNDPSIITLDYILDERTRELCGECWRWPDLAVRGVLVHRASAHSPDVAATVRPFHVLRPIPQSQLTNSTAIPASDYHLYQNPGYN